MRLPDRVARALAGASAPVCAYVYDTAVLRARAAELRAVLPEAGRLLYAVKANGHPAVVRALAAEVDGLEVASAGELALAYAELLPHADRQPWLAFSGPGKTDAELVAAAGAGAVVHVESAHELRRLSHLAGETPVRVALRVNRASARLPGTHAMTGAPTPFGIDEAEVPQACRLAAELPGIALIGFHLHAVSNNLDAAAHAAFAVDAVDWAVRAAAAQGVALGYVNIGGGLASTTPTGPPSTWRRSAPGCGGRRCLPGRCWSSSRAVT